MSIVLDGSNLTTTGVPNSGTAVASTSGTSIDFTGIPANAKRITVMFNAVSTNATNSNIMVQVGSGSISTTGYAMQIWTGASAGGSIITTGFVVGSTVSSATYALTGTVVLTNIGNNLWIETGLIGFDNVSSPGWNSTGRSPVLGGALDRIRITTLNGTDTFDAGSINILYE